MNSEIIGQLLDWKLQFHDVMPLVLTGSDEEERTSIIKEFGLRYFENTVHINLGGNPEVREFLENNPPGRDALYFIEDTCHEMIVPVESILVLNNAHTCKNIWTHIKFFSGQDNPYFAVAVGEFTPEEIQAASEYAVILQL